MLGRCDGVIQLAEEQLHEAEATQALGPGQATRWLVEPDFPTVGTSASWLETSSGKSRGAELYVRFLHTHLQAKGQTSGLMTWG